MWRLWLVLSLFFLGCGGSNYSSITTVRLVADLPGGLAGYSHWDEHGSGIQIVDIYADEYRVMILCHEIWHLLTRCEGHHNHYGCVSHDYITWYLEGPCPEETQEVNHIGRTVTLDFPEDPEAAQEAADWWNTGLGREAVLIH